MAKYVPGKKSPAGDKVSRRTCSYCTQYVTYIVHYSQGCTRRNGASIALGEDGYPRMPFALAPLTTNDDRYAQRTTVRTLQSVSDASTDLVPPSNST